MMDRVVVPSGTESQIEVLGIEPAAGQVDHGDHQTHEYGLTSAHTIDHDSWKQVGLLLVTSYNCGYILTYPSLILVPLGWAWGVACLCILGFFTFYANWLLAAFHIIQGQRFIRYRDLMGFVFGRKMYYSTWVLQFLTFIIGNIGFIVIGATSLKEINSEFSESPLRIQYFIVITGLTFFIFAVLVPTMSAMRMSLATSTILTLSFVVPLLAISLKDGKSNTKRDYEISGTKADKVFKAFAAVATVVVTSTGGLLPEIQSTLRQPAKRNMRRALYLQFTVGLAVYYGVTVAGYWAYGSSVSTYLPKDLSGPKWVKVLINSTVFIQIIISQHMFAAPIHEALDTRFLKLEQKMYSQQNLKRLFLLRAGLFTAHTFVAAAFPFIGDFVALIGSFTLFLLTFVFPSMVFIKVKGKTARIEKKIWHWANIVVFSLVAAATTTSAVRSIVNNVRVYSFFANI